MKIDGKYGAPLYILNADQQKLIGKISIGLGSIGIDQEQATIQMTNPGLDTNEFIEAAEVVRAVFSAVYTPKQFRKDFALDVKSGEFRRRERTWVRQLVSIEVNHPAGIHELWEDKHHVEHTPHQGKWRRNRSASLRSKARGNK